VQNAYAIAVDVFRFVCARLAERAGDLHHLADAGAPLDGWLEGEAYLACRTRSADHPFGEVTARPTYGSEGVVGVDGQPSPDRGGLLVGGVGGPGHHLWVFAEFVLLPDGARRTEDGRARTEAAAARLLRLGWKRSASLLIVVAAGRGDLTSLAPWSGPALADPFLLALPGGGSVGARAFDVKRDPADTLAVTTRRPQA
jgi:hypothetical protein